ncbi:putative RNA recognition motif domain, nucleotide-binding alpha-beta plait domain superfamily [Helianthus annuus]|nr:putative RNA recognition motif domain, nucleotide-binding alpha-beta plait domain superfamily [Helianthus annuus]
MGKRVWRRTTDEWNTIQNKQAYRPERRFLTREERLRNATSFFISNLPDSCDKAALWKAFEHLDNLEDVFVPAKRDRAGNKFGFVKLSNVKDSEWWIEKLKEVRVDGAVIGVNRAKFNRDGSKILARGSVFSRINGQIHPPSGVRELGARPNVFSRLKSDGSGPTRSGVPAEGHTQSVKVRSYASVVCSKDISAPSSDIMLPPMNSETKKMWEYKSLIGEVKEIDFLNDLNRHLSGIMEENFQLRYLGSLKVLLCFSCPEEAEEFRTLKVNDWEKWFSRLYVWEGLPPVYERVAWIKIRGVPLSLWDRHVFNKIGERCGRLLVKSEAEPFSGNMEDDRLAVLVHSGNVGVLGIHFMLERA